MLVVQTSGRGDFQAELQELFRADKSAPGGSRGAAFLQTFLSKRLWAEEGDDAGDSAGLLQQDGDAPLADGAADSDEDDAFLDRADDFERSYNFRCGFLYWVLLSVLVSWSQLAL